MTETKQRRKPLKYTDEFKQQLADLYRFMKRITVRRNRSRLPVCSQIIPQCLFHGSVNKFVFLEINGSFWVRIRICKFLSKRSIFMPVAKEQIRQIISENNLNSVTDVYAHYVCYL